MESNSNQSKPKRVFINDVDEFSSHHIAKFLSTCETGKEEEERDGMSVSPQEEPSFQFHVVGSVSSSSSRQKPAFLLEQYVSPTRESLFQFLLECDVVVYNVSESSSPQQVKEASWAVTALHAAAESFKAQKMFILVSSVIGWATTAPKDPSDGDKLPSDEEFWKRRPHPRFKPHNTLEKIVIKLSKMKSKLKCYVVAAGLQYGLEENIFHYFFKVSWMLETPEVPVFGQGTNHIPTIHVFDLGGVIQNIIELKPKSKYFLAIDESKDTLENIVETISDVLGSGKVCRLSMEEAVAMKALTPQEVDCLSVDLRLDAANANSLLSLSWRCQSGLVQNMESMLQEFKHSRQLQPIRICVLGPPAVGKTTVSEMVCKHYKIHHISAGKTIEEKISQLTEMMSGSQDGYFSAEAAAAAQKELEKINQSMENSQGQLTEGQVFEILQEKLNSKPCRNQGFVLDGFPETYSQATMHFSTEESESHDSDLESRAPGCNKTITPDYVFSLEASDDFLTERVRALPQSVAEEAHLEQEEFLSRLSRYRRLEKAEETVLDFFDHREIHPEHIEVSVNDPEYKGVMKRITEVVGLPKNYSRSFEEHKEEDPQKKEAERKQTLAAERRRKKEAALAEMAAQHEHKSMQEVQRQEKERLEAGALPLRNYLMEFVVPTITEAMSQCCTLKPDDPVDFLAEFLLQNKQE